MTINFNAFVESFRYMGIGMFGIFCVMAVIIGSIVLLSRATAKKEKK
jgi:hypothetical protein